MLKANSLLYAVYVCLIVAILCGALLFLSNLYNQINLFYNVRESLYIDNQSMVSFALGNSITYETPTLYFDENSGIQTRIEKKKHGVLTVLNVLSLHKYDSISSSHFVGGNNNKSKITCLYLSNFNKPLSYSGTVTLKGDLQIPSPFINAKYLPQINNKLNVDGKITISERKLPDLSAEFLSQYVADENETISTILTDVERLNDSIYYNSFSNPVIDIDISALPELKNIVIKGNFVLHSDGSILIKKSAVLEDVIVKAKRIIIENDFKGNLQAFVKEYIEIGENVALAYPSLLCLYNPTKEKSEIYVNKGSVVFGGIVLFGNTMPNIDNNTIILEENTLVVGDVYCSGRILMTGKIYGSVYTHAIFKNRFDVSSDNCIMNAEINSLMRPNYFVSLPLFFENSLSDAVLKKLF